MRGFFILIAWTSVTTASAQELLWVKHGPSPSLGRNIENVPGNEVVGSVHDVAPHPTDNNTIYVGTVNGGVWRTQDAQNTSPNWTNMTDEISQSLGTSLSISALEFDPTDASHLTLLAGTGKISAYLNVGGDRVGLIHTRDGGLTWDSVDGGGAIRGLDVTGVAARGDTLVLSSRNPPREFVDQGEPDLSTSPPPGVWRSENLGLTWARISGMHNSGLPEGESFDLVGTSTNLNVLYTNAGTQGLYRSDNSGATWTKISNAVIDAILAGGAANVEFAAGLDDNVFVGLISNQGKLRALFHSRDQGDTWNSLDLPGTSGAFFRFSGIHPGGQGEIHFSIVADPREGNVVYVGGDRQPDRREEDGVQTGPQFPNALGARAYSGRLFMVDANAQSGEQAKAITHVNTRSGSAPHPDSRDMAFSVDGNLLEVNDGGIYRRTMPRESGDDWIRNGDWLSLNGNLTNTEFHSVSWDSNFDVIVGGAQDNGVPAQFIPDHPKWRGILGGDGGVVAVDDTSSTDVSIVYASFQKLGRFTRFVRRRSPNGFTVIQTRPQLLIIPAAVETFRRFATFYTPVHLNNADATRILFAGVNGIYESLDQGDTLFRVGPDIFVQWFRSGTNPIDYGAEDNEEVIYVADGSHVFARHAAYPQTLSRLPSYPGTRTIRDLALDPSAANRLVVVDTRHVFLTTDGGQTWTDETGQLATLDPGRIRSVAYLDGEDTDQGTIAIGTDRGVFHATFPAPLTWSELGDGLPNSKVLDLVYDAADNLLVAGTQGRGAWVLRLDNATEPAMTNAVSGTPGR